MIDLSYTNKDGLNLYEGFNNGFDYHRDGASSAQGYAHGGYPEITGETSPYTDTSYRTGDVLDHWGNGNTFDIIPGTPTLVSIAVTTPPTKTSYFVAGINYIPDWVDFNNEALDLSGMVVTATYSDGSEAIVDTYETTPVNGAALTSDNTEVTVTFEGKTATQEIVVNSITWFQDNGDDGNDPATNYSLYNEQVGTWGIMGLYNQNINVDFDDTKPIEGDNVPYYPQGAAIYCQDDEEMRFVSSNGTVFNIPAYTAQVEYVVVIPNTACTYPTETAYIILKREL